MSESENENKESGAVLILAILFLTVVGLIAASLVSLTGTDLRASTVLTAGRGAQYAMDSALETAVQTVRYQATSFSGSTGTVCGSVGTSTTPAFPVINANTVMVICTGSSSKTTTRPCGGSFPCARHLLGQHQKP